MSNNPSSSNSQPSTPVPVADTLAGIQKVQDGMTDLVTLDPAKRKHTPKMQKGVVLNAPHLVQAVKDHPELNPPNVDPASITSRLARAGELALVRESLTKLLRSVKDTIIADQDAAWQDLQAIYGTIQLNAKREPALLQVIAPMEAVLAKGARAKARKANASKKASAHPVKAPAPALATGTEAPGTPAAPSPTAQPEVPQVTVVTSGPKA